MDNMEIKIIEDYVVGGLYIFNEEYEISSYSPTEEDKKLHPSFIYGEESGNVHILPLDLKISNSCSNAIAKKRKEVLREIEKIDKSLIKRNTLGGGSANCVAKTSYRNSNKLFQFIPLQYEGTNYDLIFNRFFKIDNKVSCILNCLQLKIYRGKEPNSLDSYPKSGEDFTECDKELIYYNFPVNFNESAEEIANKLISFIKAYGSK